MIPNLGLPSAVVMVIHHNVCIKQLNWYTLVKSHYEPFSCVRYPVRYKRESVSLDLLRTVASKP